MALITREYATKRDVRVHYDMKNRKGDHKTLTPIDTQQIGDVHF
jgi:hypothetical protein